MSERWYYRLLAEEFGPVETDTVVGLVREGRLTPDDLVRREQHGEWLPLRQTSLTSLAVETIGELQDLSELSFEFEESGSAGTASRRRGAETTPDADPGSGELADLSELSFEFEENAPAPARRRVSPARQEEAEPEEPSYWYQSLGQILGPVQMGELVRMADEGVVSEDDLVRCGDGGEWIPASQYDELQAAILSSRFSEPAGRESEWISEATSRRLGIQGRAPESESRSESAPAKPVAESRTEPEPAKEKAPKPAGKKKKRVARSEDAMISNILEEVFAEEEPPKSRAASSSAAAGVEDRSSPVPASPVAASPVAASPVAASPSPAAGFGGGASSPAAASGFPSAPSAGLYGQSAPRPYTPPPAPRRSSGGGSSFEFSGGTIAGLLGVLLLGGSITAFAMGWISMPKVFSSSPTDVKSTLEEHYADYRKVMGSSPAAADWSSYCAENRAHMIELAKDSTYFEGEPGRALRAAIYNMIAIFSSELSQTEKREELEKTYSENIAQATF